VSSGSAASKAPSARVEHLFSSLVQAAPADGDAGALEQQQQQQGFELGEDGDDDNVCTCAGETASAAGAAGGAAGGSRRGSRRGKRGRAAGGSAAGRAGAVRKKKAGVSNKARGAAKRGAAAGVARGRGRGRGRAPAGARAPPARAQPGKMRKAEPWATDSDVEGGASSSSTSSGPSG
jgi:hypothetical protein